MNRAGVFETIVGILVLAVAAGFLYYAYVANGAKAGTKVYRLSAVFGRVDGVDVGADVTIAGVKVGAVRAASIDPTTYEARLDLALRRTISVPEDSTAKIASDGILGTAHVSIEPGASEVMLKDGGVIAMTQGSVDLLGIAMQAFSKSAAAGGGTAAPAASPNEGEKR